MENTRIKRALLNCLRMIEYRNGKPRSDSLPSNFELMSSMIHMRIDDKHEVLLIDSLNNIDKDKCGLFFSNIATKQIIVLLGQDVGQCNVEGFVPNEFSRNVEYWNIDELQYDIGSHYLVPFHKIIDDKEIEIVLKKYNLKSRQQLPLISNKDPMSRYLHLRAGDVVQITRVSKTVGEYEVYRCCIKA